MKGSGSSLICFHSSASASQYSISFLASAGRARHMYSYPANWSCEFKRTLQKWISDGSSPLIRANLPFRNMVDTFVISTAARYHGQYQSARTRDSVCDRPRKPSSTYSSVGFVGCSSHSGRRCFITKCRTEDIAALKAGPNYEVYSARCRRPRTKSLTWTSRKKGRPRSENGQTVSYSISNLGLKNAIVGQRSCGEAYVIYITSLVRL
jgi:hypothetical protein